MCGGGGNVQISLLSKKISKFPMLKLKDPPVSGCKIKF